MNNIIVILAALCLILLSRDDAFAEAKRCTRIWLDPSKTPTWMNSGVWNSDSTEMLWADAYRTEILRVNGETGSIELVFLDWDSSLKEALKKDMNRVYPEIFGKELWELSKAYYRPDGPTAIKRDQNGILLQYTTPTSLVRVPESIDASLTDGSLSYRLLAGTEQLNSNVVSPDQSTAHSQPSSVRFISAYQLEPLGDGFLAFATIKPTCDTSDPFEAFAFVTPSAGVQLLKVEGGVDSDIDPCLARLAAVEGELAVLHQASYMPHFAAVGNLGFILNLGTTPSVLRFDPAGFLSVLEAVPASLLDRPDPLELKTERLGPGRQYLQYKAIEKAALAAGLYNIEDRLFLLKKSIVSDATRWSLIDLDLETGSIQGRYWLPSSANHLTLVVGDSYVTLVEKGPVQDIALGGPYMQIRSMTHIPTEWFSNHSDSPLAAFSDGAISSCTESGKKYKRGPSQYSWISN
ncbi:MAG: hypothetical protein AAGC60_29705 [Acidobacteriota bacterium]